EQVGRALLGTERQDADARRDERGAGGGGDRAGGGGAHDRLRLAPGAGRGREVLVRAPIGDGVAGGRGGGAGGGRWRRRGGAGPGRDERADGGLLHLAGHAAAGRRLCLGDGPAYGGGAREEERSPGPEAARGDGLYRHRGPGGYGSRRAGPPRAGLVS